MDFSEKTSKQANNRTGKDYPQQNTVKYHLRFHWLLEVGPLSSIHHVWEKYIIKEFPCILSKIRTYNWLGMLIDPEEAVGNLKVLLHDRQFFKHQSSWKLLDVSPACLRFLTVVILDMEVQNQTKSLTNLTKLTSP